MNISIIIQYNMHIIKVQSSCCALFGITINHAKLSIHLYIHITIQSSNKKYRVDKEIKIQYKDCKVILHTCGIEERKGLQPA